MLQTLARKPKSIAWFFVILFYLQLVLIPVVTRANARPLPKTIQSYKTGQLFDKNENSKAQEEPAINRQAVELKNPAHVKGIATTGPTQPEMQSFQSVNGNNLVDPFSGDFSYNIPLLDVGGYPVNLHYQSGITMDQEASWVGLGWNINPGVISRNMRGLPDDFKGGANADEVTKTVSVKPNRTIGGNFGAGVNLEVFGAPIPIGVDRSYGIFHNTYKGWGLEKETHVSISVGTGSQGELTGGLSITSNSQNGTDISPSMGFTMGSRESQLQGGITIGTNYNSRTGIQNLQISGELKRADDGSRKQKFDPGIGRFSSNISFSKPSYTPTIRIPYTSQGFSYRAKAGGQAQGFYTGSLFVQGYISEQKVETKTRTMPAYGYMYYEKAGSDQNVLLDYNREKDISWSESSPHIAIPIYTYDTWSISGEGTGGMFRPFRSDIGFVFDHKMTTKSDNDNIGMNVGFGSILKAGVDYNLVNNVTSTNAWIGDNRLVDVIKFREADTTYENVYFKNPGEKVAVDKTYQQALGGDNLMRVELAAGNRNNSLVTATRNMLLFKNARVTGKQPFNLNTVRKQRDKRSQVITYLNAEEAEVAALDKQIKWYHINSYPVSGCGYQYINRNEGERKPHHLSEITVLNPDGRRYVYGIPVYNKSQVEITMATSKDNGNNSTALVKYSSKDKSVNNNQGKDGFFNEEQTPAYSHSFLLSGILSGDYVDLTGDGITEDDNGDAVKFNYSQAYSLNSPYRWRAPYQPDSASYNEGLKTDNRDDKGSFTYGEREVWYLNSIESKTMIATFVLDADRKDGYGVIGEDGGQNAGQKLYKLKEVNLYTKADFLKHGTNARPIKTVHFEYNYELCKKNPGSLTDSGKLTLKKVWFTYNKNGKGQRNPYIFTYNAKNPDFSQRSVDRWGNYKDPVHNPGNGTAMTNADYPYTLQTGVKNWDADAAANNAAPWTLSEIKLPSGGRMKVTYESDDYAYVQNKRAMQFFSIAGFANAENSTPQAVLYPNRTANDDYHVVFINVSEPVNNAAEVGQKYLAGVNQLFFKLAVNVPGDRWGSGYELVPCYAEIENYGVASHINNKTIWVRVKAIKSRQGPFATAAIQFLRLNLPSKAYPWSEPGDKIDIRAAVGMMTSVFSGVVNLLKEANYENKARGDNRCRSVILDRSFARLDNPIYRKFGGGLRVKKVEVFDSWHKMTGQQQQEAVYGQTYTYTDTVMIDGVPTGISSGVASYEPMIGADENPFHVPAKVYAEKMGALGPTDYLYAEEPFAETFFPGPSVGYSKVRVQTIHKERKSANGFSETTFYTAKDFPTIVEYTPIDNDSKKSYKSPIKNPFFFDSRNYVTLSQGFKIELNDMHGKPRSQASYGQNDLKNPISYTYNYYKLVNDNAAQARLSNQVAIAGRDGVIDTEAEMGKEVEVMIDVREQKSVTTSGNLEANLDLIWVAPPVATPVFTFVPLFNGEANRYRSVAVLKIVNRYGILDSVLHIEKGSRVTTRNLVFDGETGDALLSQTNNEFDDPVYNFNYPAHWAYTGMAPAYLNVGTVLKNVFFRKGIMFYANKSRVPAERYFESGDELLVYGNDKRNAATDDHCEEVFFQFENNPQYKKIWAIDASRGKQGQKGFYFIDADGLPYSCDAQNIKIIRSGKRNLAGVAVGSITSQETPVRLVGGVPKLVFDTATHVIAANAAKFNDLWMVDSTLYSKDTMVISGRRMELKHYQAVATDNYAIHDYSDGSSSTALGPAPDFKYFEASAFDAGAGNWHEQIKSWLKFNMNGIPQGALIKSAKLYLYGRQGELHENYRNSNECYLERLKAQWPREIMPATNYGDVCSAYFYDNDHTTVDQQNRIMLPETTQDAEEARNEEGKDITAMAQAMLDDYYISNGIVSPGIRISLLDVGSGVNKLSRLTYNSGKTAEECPLVEYDCKPYIDIQYYDPCADGSHPVKLDGPLSGDGESTMMMAAAVPAPVDYYYCFDQLVKSFVCRPNINDTAVNFYRFGILGNWRMDRAYTYYSRRQQSDPSTATNIRKDGVIADFAPFWSFTNTPMTASNDESRWVWNSELTRFNNKGFEIENHDPLNRFNAGQYGYNNTLPVAVAQNARSREIAYDGFEDYGYQTNNCKNCLMNRHVDFGSDANLVETESHTGLYSLRVEGNSSFNKSFNLGSVTEDGLKPELSMKEDSIPLVSTVVNGNGTGLGNYYYTNGGGCYPYEQNKPPLYTGINSDVNYKTGVNPISNTCRTDWIYYSFRGYIQPRYTGVYKFWVTTDDAMSIFITKNGQSHKITAGRTMEIHDRSEQSYATAYETESIALEAGELYYIQILWDNNNGGYQAKLEWQTEDSQLQGLDVVPVTQLYPEGSDINTVKANTVFRDTNWCVQFKPPTAANVINKRFSPLQKQKVVVSTWVKQEGPCSTGSYDGVRLNLTFNNQSGASFFSLKPTGTIIEGWQRIEDTLTIPETATQVSVSMNATSTAPVYFDDIRVQPFNSSMKSFVYNPLNLRLMAELDENNYATYYEYDDEGTLIRLKKETERGIKTIKETRSAMSKE
ncbi:GLEYA domain-containing protein [Niastella populi]|uniref:PA14 domain-containing protein n=1 Tax=Niastella populi TaxID=550983 RepID=A0A1V9GCJ5_9BACT|nr:GLEYA domain-containing protein [Niastella populi]OQP68405.1 hypothetical protein A4R26_00940 [Niastella populi]